MNDSIDRLKYPTYPKTQYDKVEQCFVNNTYVETQLTFDLDKHFLDQKSNLACWWCCHTFTTNVFYTPIQWKKIKKKMVVTGNFCSLSCSRAYTPSDKQEIFRLMCSLFYNLTPSRYPRKAPPRQRLDTFCNNGISIEQFRNLNDGKIVSSCVLPARATMVFELPPGIYETTKLFNTEDGCDDHILSQMNARNKRWVRTHSKPSGDKMEENDFIKDANKFGKKIGSAALNKKMFGNLPKQRDVALNRPTYRDKNNSNEFFKTISTPSGKQEMLSLKRKKPVNTNGPSISSFLKIINHP